MKSLPLLFLASILSPVAAFADLNIRCEVYAQGRSAGICETTLSSGKGSGEIRLEPGESTTLARKAGCSSGRLELALENVTKVPKLGANASEIDRFLNEANSKLVQDRFLIAIVEMPKKKKKKAKVRVGNTYEDFSYGTITGRLSYTVNGDGLDCSISNR